jgi:hypothetical protein
MAKAKKKALPKTMGACADALFTIRNNRLAAQKQVDAMQAEENELKEYIINTLPVSDTGAAGKLARVTVSTKTIPQVKDWEAFWKGFDKKKDIDLLQRRLNDEAVKERWDNGKKVPGVETFQTKKVSINKV